MRITPILAIALATCSLTLSGCLARAASSVITAPVKVASKAADLATTSQSEADENRGREIRRREARLAKLERQYREESEDCADGNRGACKDAEKTREEIEELLPQVPLEPR